MIKVYVTHGYKNNEIALKYGLGYFLNMLYKALNHNKNIMLVFEPDNADIIHVNEPVDLSIIKYAKKHNKVLVSHFHSLQYTKEFKYAMDNSDLNIFVSKLLASMYDAKNYKVLYNAIVPQNTIYSNCRPVDFIITGRNSISKGINLEKLKDNKFIVMVTGDMHIDGLINCGYLDSYRFNKVLSISKMHLLPSIFEPFGIATLYAMSQGCIPVVSVNSGIAEILPENITIFINPNDINLRKIYDEYDNRGLDYFRYDVIKFARSHDYVWYSDRIYEIYSELVR